MRQYFTSLQVFIAAALAMVFFIGILWAEKASFDKESELQNPFDLAEMVNERVVVQGDTPQSWLHENGEIFMLMPGAKLNLTNQVRELEEGVLFLNTSLQTQSDIDKARTGFEPPFDLSGKRLSGGQMRIGPLVVTAPQGVVVLKRDLVRQEALIYAHDHAAQLYFPGANEAFLIPPGYMVLVKESRASLLAPLYFTKLKKELDLKPLNPTSLGMESVQSALLQGLELSKLWEVAVIEYAENSVTSVNRYAPSSLMGRLLSMLTYVQRYYALGVDQSFKDNYEYEVLTAEIKDAYFAFADVDKEKSVEKALAFNETRAGSQWARYFIETPFYKAVWNQFAQQQRVWFYGEFPGNLEVAALKALWGPSPSFSTFADFESNYYLFETYYAENYVAPAQEQLQFILDNFENLDLENGVTQLEATFARRQVGLLLQRDVGSGNSQIFELYIELVKAERILMPNESEFSQEIRLEVAQELLFFLDLLLGDGTRPDEVILLLQAYKTLEISKLAESLGRTVFNERERDTLERVQSFGDISEEDEALLRQDKLTVDEVIALRNDLKDQESAPVVTGPIGIQTEEDLTELLNNRRILTQGMRLQTREKDDSKFITFSQATFVGYPVEGTFVTGRQQFSLIKMGEVSETRATASNLGSFLTQMLNENKKINEQDNVGPVDSGPNNGTSTAILQRRNILKILQQQKVDARFDNVLLTNDKFTKAKIDQASFDKKYLLTFDFDLGPPMRVRNLTVQFGRSNLLFPNQVFKYETLEEDLLKAINAKLEENSLGQ